MGANWQKRKTERAYGMRWRQEGGAGDTQTARPCTAAAMARLGGVGAADLQEAVLGLAPGKLSMGKWVVGRWFHGPAKPRKPEQLALIWLCAVKLLLEVLRNALRI